jgi:hypothetical protein
MTKETKIFALYIGVQGIRGEDIPTVVEKITERIAPETFLGEIIVIPTQSPDTRIECINPKYITDAELIKEHTEKMKELHELLQHQLEQLKEENDG